MVEMNLPLPHLLKHLLSGRWMMAVVSFYILSCAGTSIVFGIYSGTIKKELHYDQERLNTLSFFKDVGSSVGIMAGLMNEILPAWIVLLVGACMNICGYLMVWLAVTHRIARPPAWQMKLFICAAANAQTFTNTGVMVTFVKNFPQGRGEVLGIIKGFVGLSGALFTQVYLAVYGEDARGLILLIALLPSLVTFMFMFFIRLLKPVHDTHEKRNFYSFLYLAMLIAVFLLLAIIVENEVQDLPPWAYKAFGAASVMMVVSSMAIGVRAESAYMKLQGQELGPATKGCMVQSQELSTAIELHNSGIIRACTLEDEGSSSVGSALNSNTQENHEDKWHEQAMDSVAVCRPPESKNSPPALAVSEPSLKNTERSSSKTMLMTKLKLFFRNWPERGDDFTILQALFSMDLWILFLSTACGLATIVTTIDNMGQIAESLGYSKQNISTLVSLISIWNFFGRVAAGFGSEILLRYYHCPRTLLLMLVIVISCIGHILIAFPATNTLYIASIIHGFCFGAEISLYFTILSELFGLKYYATLQSVRGLVILVGTYLLNVKVTGYLYDRAAERQHAHMHRYIHGGIKCMGYECFRLSFVIMTIVSGFGSLVSYLLTIRTRKFYSQDIYSRFHVKQSGQQEEPM